MKKVENVQLIAFLFLVVFIVLNVALILKPMMSESMSAVFVGKIDGQFARLTLNRDGTYDYYSMARKERLYGHYASGQIRDPDVAGAIILDHGHAFGFNIVFTAIPARGAGRLYNINAIAAQIMLAAGYATCIFFGFVRVKLHRRELDRAFIK